jgi:hypothetical protein
LKKVRYLIKGIIGSFRLKLSRNFLLFIRSLSILAVILSIYALERAQFVLSSIFSIVKKYNSRTSFPFFSKLFLCKVFDLVHYKSSLTLSDQSWIFITNTCKDALEVKLVVFVFDLPDRICRVLKSKSVLVQKTIRISLQKKRR